MQHFTFYHKENFLAFTKTRNGEIKLGETIQAISNEKKWYKEIESSSAKFVIVGIPEDIGVKANYGTGGTQTAWPAFLSSFFNIQHTDFLKGDSILLLGYFDFSDLNAKTGNKPVEYLREMVAQVDKHLSALVQKIVEAGKIPVIIGGGHNNAYGNICGAATGLHNAGKLRSAKINVINFDAHADLRQMEGRHSGNAFTYALHESFIKKYAMLGLHENYITQSILDVINKNKNLRAVFFEDISVRHKISFEDAVQSTLGFTIDTYTGIEIDLDAIENTLSSAITPSGFSSVQARSFIHAAASSSKIAYLHICEGAAQLQNGTSSSGTGKLISYLVSDFIKACK